MPMKSCEKCGKTIINGDFNKILVGCEHYPIENIPEFIDIDSLFGKIT